MNLWMLMLALVALDHRDVNIFNFHIYDVIISQVQLAVNNRITLVDKLPWFISVHSDAF